MSVALAYTMGDHIGRHHRIRWIQEAQKDDPIFGPYRGLDTRQRARDLEFLAFNDLKDEEFDQGHLLGRGFARYAPSLRNQEALESYPVCQEMGMLHPFVYTNHYLACSKNGPHPTLIASTSELTRRGTAVTWFESCHGCTVREDTCDLEVGVTFTEQDTVVFGPEGQYSTLQEALEYEWQDRSSSARTGDTSKEDHPSNMNTDKEERSRNGTRDLSSEDREGEELGGGERGGGRRKRKEETNLEGGEQRQKKKIKDDDWLVRASKVDLQELLALIVRKEMRETVRRLKGELEDE